MNLTEVEQQLQKSTLFAALEAGELRELVRNAELVSYKLGQVVVGSGQAATGFYVLLSGRVRVLAEREGREYVVSTLQAGAHFGEDALIRGLPQAYAVRAAEDSVTLRVPIASFQELLRENPELESYFQRYINEVSIQAFLKLFTLLTPLAARDIKALLGKLEERTYDANAYVFREGDAGDAFYIIRDGRAEVVKERDGRSVRLLELKDGDFFGELALMYGTPRNASVRCLEPTRVFRLDSRVFEELVEHAPEVKERILEVVSHYNLEQALRKKWGMQETSAPFPTAPSSLPQEPPPPSPSTPERQPREDKPTPPVRLFGRYPFLRQHDETDCGAACLAMVLRYWGTRVGISRLRDMANVGREGASLLSLAQAAEELGFSARGMRAGYDALLKMQLPAIVHWEGNHYVVLYRATSRGVLVGDPGIGMRKMSVAEFKAGWTGHLLHMIPTPKLADVEDKKASLARFLPLLSPFRWILLEIFVASLLLDTLGLAFPIFTQVIVDRVLVHQNVQLLTLMVSGMIVVTFFQLAITAARQMLLFHVSNKLDLSMLVIFYRHLLGLPLEYFQKRKIGDFIARFGETARIRQLITGTAITTILDTMMVFVYLALMFYYNVGLTLALLAFVPLFALVTWSFTPVLKRVNREVFARRAESESFLIESISGMQTVKSMAIERGMRWKWEEMYVRALNIGARGQTTRTAIDAISGAVSRVSSIVMLYLGATLVIKGQLTVGQLMAFNALIGSVLGPIGRLIGLWDDIQETLVSVERLNDVLDSELEQDKDRTSLITLPPLRGHVKLDNVSFRYGTKEDKNVLTNVSMEIYPGQTVAIVGRSGSGKTTLAKLIMGMYRPSEGKILVDGHDLNTVHLPSYRRQLGVVMQDSFLFSGTIRENVALGDPTPDMERVASACVLANAHDFISEMALGYDTLVGERGMSVSGGQRQRIAIARALYGDPRLIVLDEATSSLDTESESAIQTNLRRVLADRTAIIIAHRLSTVQEANAIIVIDQGVIVETGTHRSLMEQKGLYYYLNSQQLKL